MVKYFRLFTFLRAYETESHSSHLIWPWFSKKQQREFIAYIYIYIYIYKLVNKTEKRASNYQWLAIIYRIVENGRKNQSYSKLPHEFQYKFNNYLQHKTSKQQKSGEHLHMYKQKKPNTRLINIVRNWTKSDLCSKSFLKIFVCFRFWFLRSNIL